MGDAFRPSRARRALRQSEWLESAGVPTARVVAAADDRFLRWPRRGYVLSERIQQPTTLAQLLVRNRPLPRAGVTQLAQLLARLHRHRLSHRDLKASNVLFDGRGDPFLIDLDGVRRVRLAARSRAVDDLARLAREVAFGPAVSRRLAVWFLRAYCRNRGLPDWRWWWRAIESRRF
jgi:tRNA A-37 threonylcarbamoyl transferase component Bud32